MSSDRELLEAVYDEMLSMKEEIKKLNGRMEILEMLLIDADLSEEELAVMESLAEDRDGVIAWARLKEDLGL